MKIKLEVFLIGVWLFLFFHFGAVAEAVVRLDVSPVGGGNSIRFGRVDHPSLSDQEVRIRVTTTDNQQYQVFQRIGVPLTNERSESLDTRALVSAALSGSNGSGTLYLQNEEPLGYTDQLIYTSNEDGFSDNFILVYHVNTDDVLSAGSYRGQIIYTVRSFEGGGDDEIVLDVFLDAGGGLEFDVRTSSGQNLIRLENTEAFRESGLVFSYKNNFGAPFEISSEWLQIPTNELGASLAPESLLFQVLSNTDELLTHQEFSPFLKGRQKIFSSRSAEDVVEVKMIIDDQKIDEENAGLYRGKLRYNVIATEEMRNEDIDIEIEIRPIFELVVTLPPEGMRFTRLIPDTPPQLREINVSVKTNLGRPYQVTQKMIQPLVNENGTALNEEHYLFRQEIISGDGEVSTQEFLPVSVGETVVFNSGREGKASDFRVIYRLEPYSGMEAGDYQTQIIYSLSEM